MRCPKCRSTKSIVADSRPRDDDHATIRKRKCTFCNNIFHTVEIFYTKPKKVKKTPAPPKLDPKRIKKAEMEKRLKRIKRREAFLRIDSMTDDELEQAMFSGQDLKDLGID